MLIQLDESLTAYANSNANNKVRVTHALNTLALSRREGNHFIFSEIATLHELLSSLTLNELTISILTRVINRYPEKAALASQLKAKAVIGDFAEISISIEDKKKILRIPVDNVNLALVQKTYLLVENLVDADFYKSLTHNSNLGHIPIDFEAYPGGGNTTAEALKHISGLNRLCLCIVDSDIRYFGGPMGDTAKKVVIAADEIAPSLTEHYVLPVCSIENLIPIETLIEAVANDLPQIERVENLLPIYLDDVWPYFGLKRGIRCSDVVDKSSPSELFWGAVVGEREELNECANDGGSTRCAGKKCPNFLFNSLGSNTLSTSVAFLQREKKFVGNANVAAVQDAWDEISDLITAWCCSGSPVFSG